MAALTLAECPRAQRGYPGNFRPNNIAVGGSPPVAFFAANDGGGQGVEPWVYDPAATPPLHLRQLADIEAGGAGSFPDQFTPISGQQVFFTARTCSGAPGCVSDRELYFHDTGTSTTRSFDLRPGPQGSFPSGLTPVGSRVFFSADDGVAGRELWVSDGTTCTRVSDIAPGPSNSSPHNLIALGSNVLFAATDGSGDTELWISGGTLASTVRVLDIEPGGSSFPGEMAELGGRVYFAATTVGAGRELWSTDGTTAGTLLVQDLRAGSAGSSPDQLTPDPVNQALAFTAVDAVRGRTLWIHKPTVGSLAVNVSNGRTVANLVAAPIPDPLGAFWFTHEQTGEGRELALVTAALGVDPLPVRTGAQGSRPTSLRATATSLLFRADDGVTGQEPWKFDGAGLTQLGDIKTGSGPTEPKTSFASPFVPFGTEFLFAAENDSDGLELWKTDGTPGGTVLVADMDPAAPTSTTHLRAGSLTIEISDDPPPGGTPGAALIGTAPSASPVVVAGFRGALLLDPSSIVVGVPFVTDVSGNFSITFPIPPGITVPPLGVQSVLLLPVQTAGFSNLDPYSLGSCSDPASGVEATGEGIVCDETGEYNITVCRTESPPVPITAYFALVYENAAGELEMLTSGDDTGDGCFSLEAGECVDLHGFVDLYSADDPSDASATKSLQIRMLTEPPTPENLGSGCVVWSSYC